MYGRILGCEWLKCAGEGSGRGCPLWSNGAGGRRAGFHPRPFSDQAPQLRAAGPAVCSAPHRDLAVRSRNAERSPGSICVRDGRERTNSPLVLYGSSLRTYSVTGLSQRNGRTRAARAQGAT